MAAAAHDWMARLTLDGFDAPLLPAQAAVTDLNAMEG